MVVINNSLLDLLIGIAIAFVLHLILRGEFRYYGPALLIMVLGFLGVGFWIFGDIGSLRESLIAMTTADFLEFLRDGVGWLLASDDRFGLIAAALAGTPVALMIVAGIFDSAYDEGWSGDVAGVLVSAILAFGGTFFFSSSPALYIPSQNLALGLAGAPGSGPVPEKQNTFEGKGVKGLRFGEDKVVYLAAAAAQKLEYRGNGLKAIPIKVLVLNDTYTNIDGSESLLPAGSAVRVIGPDGNVLFKRTLRLTGPVPGAGSREVVYLWTGKAGFRKGKHTVRLDFGGRSLQLLLDII